MHPIFTLIAVQAAQNVTVQQLPQIKSRHRRAGKCLTEIRCDGRSNPLSSEYIRMVPVIDEEIVVS